jgi:restriction system protein
MLSRRHGTTVQRQDVLVADNRGRLVDMPTHTAMAWPTLLVLREADREMTNAEIVAAVADRLDLTAAQRTLPRTERSQRTLLDYRLAWTRTLLKQVGAIVNERPARWTVTEAGRSTAEADIQAYVEQMLKGFDRTNSA